MHSNWLLNLEISCDIHWFANLEDVDTEREERRPRTKDILSAVHELLEHLAQQSGRMEERFESLSDRVDCMNSRFRSLEKENTRVQTLNTNVHYHPPEDHHHVPRKRTRHQSPRTRTNQNKTA